MVKYTPEQPCIFDQIWPVRTTTEMKRVVASILKDASRVVALTANEHPRDSRARESDILRHRLAKDLSTVRTLNEAAQYEFGPDRDRHIRTAGKLMEMAMTSVALVWNHVAILNRPDENDSDIHPELAKVRQAIREGLFSMADAIDNEHATESERLMANESSSEYVRLTVSRFNELQLLSAAFDS